MSRSMRSLFHVTTAPSFCRTSMVFVWRWRTMSITANKLFSSCSPAVLVTPASWCSTGGGFSSSDEESDESGCGSMHEKPAFNHRCAMPCASTPFALSLTLGIPIPPTRTSILHPSPASSRAAPTCL